MKNIFDSNVSNEFVSRINQLTPQTQPKWGKMNVQQMLAHCNVTYEMAYETKHPKATGFKKFMLKMFVKPIVVGDKAYSQNSRTAPEFLITDERKFEVEKQRLIEYIHKTVSLGEKSFEGKESNSFGALNAKEWNAMFTKHLEHHLSQFGV
jgi:hypothetical protein